MQDYHIYCHIPFCKKRCRYCYFTAKFKEHEMVNLKNLDSYVKALVKNIHETDIMDGKLQSIVFGGGTPSLLNQDQLYKIIAAIRSKVSDEVFENLQHMAYEVSPDTASLETLSAFRNVGFNRISIGVQSFDDNELKILGRPYKNQAIKDAMINIRKLKYDLVNVDLLIGIPGQTKESIIFSVNEALLLRPEHLSISLFYKSYPGGLEFVEDCEEKGYKILTLDDKIEVYEKICSLIKDAGYERVDNTVFSLPGYIFTYEKDSICGTESVLAFGPGSSGYWNGVIRYTPPEIEKYIEKPECVCKEFSVETNAYATIWGHLNAYGYIKEEEIKKNFNLSIEQLIQQDDSVEKLIASLKNYTLIDCSHKYCIKPEAINKAIVIMQHCKDDWGYRLITAPQKNQEEKKMNKNDCTELIRKVKVGYLATCDTAYQPYVRPVDMGTIYDGNIYFATFDNTDKVKQIAQQNKADALYYKDYSQLRIIGIIEEVKDMKIITRFMEDNKSIADMANNNKTSKMLVFKITPKNVRFMGENDSQYNEIAWE